MDLTLFQVLFILIHPVRNDNKESDISYHIHRYDETPMQADHGKLDIPGQEVYNYAKSAVFPVL